MVGITIEDLSIDIEQVILTMVVLFALAKLAALLFKKYGLPGLVGEIIVGILVANLTIGDFCLMEWLDLKPLVFESGSETQSLTFDVVNVFAEFGVIFLLFAVGLETKVKDLMSVGKAAILVALLGVVMPFLLGYVYIIFLYDGNLYHALFMGAAMVATSVGITARVIKDMELMHVKESRIIIGAAVFDDVLGMIVLAIVSGMAQSGTVDVLNIAKISIIAIVFVVAVIAFAGLVVPRIHDKLESRKSNLIADRPGYIPMKIDMFAVAIIVCLFVAYLATLIGLAAIIGAFLGGMFFAEYAWEWKLEEKFEHLSTIFISFFFVYVGMKVDLSAFFADPSLIFITVVVLVLACIGKYVGCGLGAKIADPKMSFTSLSIIGVGMIPRGEVGIIIALYGVGIIVDGAQVLSPQLYSVIVLMCIVTTLIAPPILSKLYKARYHGAYDVPEEQVL